MSRLAATLAAVVVLLFTTPGRAVEPAGAVVRLVGNAIATMSNGFSRPLSVGSTLLVGDRIETAAGSRLQMRMSDDSIVTLGESSAMVIDLYGTAEENGFGLMKVVNGIFLAASGALAKIGPDHFVIETPSAVLGIRGTEVWGQLSDDNRLDVALLSGTGIIVTAQQGQVEMTEANNGITVTPGAPLPAPRPWSEERLAAARETVSFPY